MLARQYNTEMLKALNQAAAEIRTAERLGELTKANLEAEIEDDLPAYLVFLILVNIKKLEQVSPDHILVKTVRACLDSQPPDDPMQGSFDI